jgi:predicted house-cleaning noncanonical NTP pyrophosphatase (MazG superfamily)
MARQTYNKLVRDRIPEIIQREGRTCGTDTLSIEAFDQALREKLIEEAQEIAAATPDKLIMELADLYEVIDVLLESHHIEDAAVIAEQQRRSGERGSFKRRLRLLWTD